MAKPLITITNSLVADFNTYFDGNNVPFVVLGNTAQHQQLASQAAAQAQNWEVALYVPDPTDLYPTLLTLATDDCALAPIYDSSNLFAVCLATDKTICYVMTTYDPPSIPLAYMSAETYPPAPPQE